MCVKRIRRLLAALLLLACLCEAGLAAAEKNILLTFTGDVTLGGKDDERGYDDCFDAVAAAKGYDYFFANFAEMFKKDDLTIVNLECVLTDNRANKAAKKHPFRGKTDFAKILAQSGIELAGLSNNHTADYGNQGLKSTIKALEDNGVNWFKDFTYYMFEKDGVKIAFVALQNSVIYTKYPKLKKLLASLREEEGASAVIACWHTGTEYKGTHDKDTEKTVTSLIEENGVDLVIINHTHTAQGVGIVNNRSVFYSLGNFVFGGNRHIRGGRDSKDPLAISLYGNVVQVKLTFTDQGKYLGQQATAYPVFSSGVNPDYQVGDHFNGNKGIISNDYRPIRLTLAQAAAVYDCMKRDTAFELPAMTEKNGLAEIVFPYLPAFDDVMMPEEEEAGRGPTGLPEAASPTPGRDTRANH